MHKPESKHPLQVWRESREPPLSAVQVADLAQISPTSLSKVERGHRDRLSADACRSLVKAFPGELDLEQLLAFKWKRSRRRPSTS